MEPYQLKPIPLTAETFAPFGDVIEANGRQPIMINDGNTERYDSLAIVECDTPQDSAVINIFRAQPRSVSANQSMRIEMMERHPLGSQSFHPLSDVEYLVLVADPVETLRPENLTLFLASGQQGVNYRKNTWHHPVLGLHRICDFLVVDRKGAGNNCEEFYFDKEHVIEISL